jgi:hypothetical protein
MEKDKASKKEGKMNIFCFLGFHSPEIRKEKYTITFGNGLTLISTNLDVSTCKKCGERKAYTVLKEYAPRRANDWKDWSFHEGDHITWEDLKI